MKKDRSEPEAQARTAASPSLALRAQKGRAGLFFSLDGIDGCGKSTQWQRLVKWLRDHGHIVTPCREPGGTALGDLLRDILLHKSEKRCPAAEALLFMASRAELVAEVIEPALKRGEIVVSDRYLLSTIVYQGHGRGLDTESLWQVGQFATAGIEPDLTLVLDLPVEVARSRVSRQPDRMESEKDDFFQRVREGFLSEARKQLDRFAIIDATQTAEDVHAQIIKEVSSVLETDSGA